MVRFGLPVMPNDDEKDDAAPPFSCLCWLGGGECFVGDRPPRDGGRGVASSAGRATPGWMGVSCGAGPSTDDGVPFRLRGGCRMFCAAPVGGKFGGVLFVVAGMAVPCLEGAAGPGVAGAIGLPSPTCDA